MLLAVALWSFFPTLSFPALCTQQKLMEQLFYCEIFFRAVGSSKIPGGQIVIPKSFDGKGFASIPVKTWWAIVPSVPPVPTAQIFCFFLSLFLQVAFSNDVTLTWFYQCTLSSYFHCSTKHFGQNFLLLSKNNPAEIVWSENPKS